MNTKNSPTNRPSPGFTLVELLVVLAIIGIIVAILLPAVQSAREAARQAMCKNHLKQIGLALQLYHDSYRVFPWAEPPSTSHNTWAWSTEIFPFIEQQNVYDQIDWNHESNSVFQAQSVKHLIPVYQCASASANTFVSCCVAMPGLQDSGETNYVAVGTNKPVRQALSLPNQPGAGVMNWGSSTRISDVIDGTSSTFIVTEADMDQDDPWRTSQSGPSDPMCANLACVIGHEWRANSVVSTGWGINADTELMFPGLNSRHPGGVYVLLVDGHVQFVSETINKQTLDALVTFNGGEVASLD